MTNIIIATGGTGGHIFPAQAVAAKLVEQNFKVIIFGDKNYSKYHKPSYSYSFKTINSSQIKNSPLALIKAACKITAGIVQAVFLLLKYQPQAIIAFGGYATFPVLIAAIILRKRIILHEQNAHLGKVNRIFASFADKIALSYLNTEGISDKLVKNKLIFTGNPIREEIAALSKMEYHLPNLNQSAAKTNNLANNLGYNVLLASDFQNQNISNDFNILVIGGSGGAKIFSEILPKAFFNLRGEIKNHLSITQQCRSEYVKSTFDQYQSFNLNITINSFFDDMKERIEKAHLVIARAGSSSLAEFTCAKKPMILIPFALAADNHQEKNALALEKAGGAIVIREADFTINYITSILEKLIDNNGLLKKMSASAFKCANLEATSNVVNLITRQ